MCTTPIESTKFESMKFELGHLVMTHGIAELSRCSPAFAIFVQDAISRFTQGDWGVLDEEDKAQNVSALQHGEQLMGAYVLGQTRIWIITEADRSATTVLLPEEY